MEKDRVTQIQIDAIKERYQNVLCARDRAHAGKRGANIEWSNAKARLDMDCVTIVGALLTELDRIRRHCELQAGEVEEVRAIMNAMSAELDQTKQERDAALRQRHIGNA
jgi:hypothetical protein